MCVHVGSEYANLPNDVGQALVLYQTNGTGIQVDAPFKKVSLTLFDRFTRSFGSLMSGTLTRDDLALFLRSLFLVGRPTLQQFVPFLLSISPRSRPRFTFPIADPSPLTDDLRFLFFHPVSTHGVSKYRNLTIVGIDEVVNLPPTIGAFATQNASSIATVLSTADLVDALEGLKGVTIFLPTNEAVEKLGADNIAGLNATALAAILQNHVIPKQVVYPTGLGDAKDVLSLGGEKFTFGNNGGNATVQSGNGLSPFLLTFLSFVSLI